MANCRKVLVAMALVAVVAIGVTVYNGIQWQKTAAELEKVSSLAIEFREGAYRTSLSGVEPTYNWWVEDDSTRRWVEEAAKSDFYRFLAEIEVPSR